MHNDVQHRIISRRKKWQGRRKGGGREKIREGGGRRILRMKENGQKSGP